VAQEPAADFRGGVAIVIDQLDPPVTTTDVSERIGRMRAQPDWSSTAGRKTKVFGLEAADPAAPQGAQKAVAILVSDSELNSLEMDLEIWDRDLAAQEWELVQQALTQQASLDQVSSFSPVVAENLAATAVVAVVLSLIGMLAYIWVRFGSFRFSFCTVLALVFNMIVCLGALAYSGMLSHTGLGAALHMSDFRIDLNVVAGLLTVLGYGLNDTVVILDRVRENRGKATYATRNVVNSSINQSFGRTVLTGGNSAQTVEMLDEAIAAKIGVPLTVGGSVSVATLKEFASRARHFVVHAAFARKGLPSRNGLPIDWHVDAVKELMQAI
jgi:SecD/SecF fusion protein